MDITAPLARCLKCETTAPLRAAALQHQGENLPGFEAPAPWKVTKADRPEGWTAWPTQARDLRVGLCPVCTEAKQAAEAAFLLDDKNLLSRENLKDRLRATGLAVEEAPAIVEPPLPPAPPPPPPVVERRRTIPTPAQVQRTSPRVLGPAIRAHVQPAASAPHRHVIAPQQNFAPQATAVRSTPAPAISTVQQRVNVQPNHEPVRAPTVTTPAQAVGGVTYVEPANTMVTQTAPPVPITHQVAAPALSQVQQRPQSIEVKGTVTGIPTAAKSEVPTTFANGPTINPMTKNEAKD